MTATIRVFVNAAPLDLPAGSRVSAAILALDPELAQQVSAGSAYVTDGRGIQIAGDSPLTAGAILRVIVSARRSQNVDADA
ncbi:MAG TPA: hypothetical protein VKA25_01290 [Gemmatimonadales bacterium]|nr:hypothetical protein [Gemmatimonadales bacterium]